MLQSRKKHDCIEEIFYNSTDIEPECVHHSINFSEECEKQRRTLSGDSDEKFEIENFIECNVNLDVFLFKGKIIRGVFHLIARNNPLTGTRFSKKNCEDSFERLHEKEMGV